MRTQRTRNRRGVQPTPPHGPGPKGLSTPGHLRIGPKEMRIPPLRSAVKTGSDVSLGSSVTPDRFADPVTERGPFV